MAKLPVLSIARNNANKIFIGLDEFNDGGLCVRSCVLAMQEEYTAQEVMYRRFLDMARLMAGNVDVPDWSIQDYVPLEDN